MGIAVTAARLLLYHKHSTSARTRFLCSGKEQVLLFEPLPKLATLLEERERHPHPQQVVEHPAQLLRRAQQLLGLESGAIELDGHTLGVIDSPAGPIPVYLGHFTTIDPPFAAAEGIGSRFIPITEARHLSVIELELLRRAYVFVLGG